MVTILFKYTEVGSVQLKLDSPEPLSSVLEKCSSKVKTELDGIIAVRDGKVLQPADTIQTADTITIFPGLSGG